MMDALRAVLLVLALWVALSALAIAAWRIVDQRFLG